MTPTTARTVVLRGDMTVDVELDLHPGTTTALLGPNGAGKSTVLRALAGLTMAQPESMLPDPHSVGLVHQDYLLFPHLSVVDNVAFGLMARGTRRRDARRRAQEALESAGLGDLAQSRPAMLSGGQAQRVALLRTLVTEPRLLLLDEPLAALDAQSRITTRSDLRRRLRSFSGASVVVTHDALDALVLADEVVILEHGRVVQRGRPEDVVRRPATHFVATLVGVTLMRGTARDGRIAVDGGGELAIADTHLDGRVIAVVRPASVTIHLHQPEGSARNAWAGVVTDLVRHGDGVRISIDTTPRITADVTPAAVAALGLDIGVPVWASVKATEIDAYADSPAG